MKIEVPASIPAEAVELYKKNIELLTRGTGRLALFACDQKMEHLNADFYGSGIAPEDNDPKHLFDIASKGKLGAFATHLGLVSQYGKSYSNVNYIIKLNGKTNLVPTAQQDPVSLQLWSVDDVVEFAQSSGLSIPGVGYTLYLGSEYEAQMMQEAAQIIYQAHQYGLVSILWVYPRGKAVKSEKSPEMIAGATGVGVSLGADFIKINMPDSNSEQEAIEALAVAVQAAGKSKVIVAGGKAKTEGEFLAQLYEQLHAGNAAGCATGRNIHQRSLESALKLTEAIAALVYENQSLEQVLKIVK